MKVAEAAPDSQAHALHKALAWVGAEQVPHANSVASAGLAPTLFDVTEVDWHSLLVTMELLPESWRVLSDL